MTIKLSDTKWDDIVRNHSEKHFFVRHSSTVWQNKGSDKVLREQMIAAGADPKRANITFTRMENKYTTRFNNARRAATEAIAEVGIAWSTARIGEARNATNSGGYLVRLDDWYELSQKLQKSHEAWEYAIREDVYKKYDEHIKDGLRAYRALTNNKHEMSTEQRAKHYPPLQEIKGKFNWDVYKEGVNTTNGENKRLKGSRYEDLFREMAEDAQQAQMRGISNVLESLVGGVVSLADKQADMIARYDPSADNQRDGNTLPYKSDWEKMPDIADRLEDWELSLYGKKGSIHVVAEEVRSLHQRLTTMSGDNMGEMRGILGGEDSSARDEVRERLDNLGDTASSVLNDLLLS